jgi:PKD repeat protein
LLKIVRIHQSRSCLLLGSIVIVLAVLAAPVMGAMGTPMNARDLTGTNMEGIDHWNTVVGNAQECSVLCDNTPGCAGATYVLPNTIQGPAGHCWRKSAVTGDTENFNCISFEKLTVLPVVGCVMSNPSAELSYVGGYHGSGSAPLIIQFTDLSTGAMAWSWDFGDGSPVSHEKNPAHTYTTGSPEGTVYAVTLTVTGSCPGETNTVKRPNIIRIFDKVGFLTLASTPGGAAVIVDGKFLGNTSTTTSEGLPLVPGSHTVLLTLDGYRDYSATVTIVNGDKTQIAPVLEKTTSTPAAYPSATGSLQITTTPDGASVSIDGASKGTTPLTVPGLAAGSHTVRLTKVGYTDYTGTLTLPAGKTTLLNITLVAAPGTTTTTTPTSPQVPTGVDSLPATQAPSGTGSLTVQSTPTGANVYLDGEKMGTTPVRVPGVAPGTHRLLLTLQGYNDISQPVEIAGGTENEVSASFLSKKTPGFAGPAVLAALALLLLVRSGKRKGE